LSDDLSHGEIQELLGAYALDAVDETERAVIDAHLDTCGSCRVELEDHRRLAETMRRHASRVSPLASVESNGSARNGGAVAGHPTVGRWRVAVATMIVVMILGGLFVGGEIRFNDADARMQRIELLERAQLAAADPASIVTILRTPRYEAVLTVVSRPAGGDSYAMNGVLPSLATGQTYQLWRVSNGVETPAVALGRRPDAVAFSLPPGVTGLILTVERGPAPSRPTLPAVASALVSQ